MESESASQETSGSFLSLIPALFQWRRTTSRIWFANCSSMTVINVLHFVLPLGLCTQAASLLLRLCKIIHAARRPLLKDLQFLNVHHRLNPGRCDSLTLSWKHSNTENCFWTGVYVFRTLLNINVGSCCKFRRALTAVSCRHSTSTAAARPHRVCLTVVESSMHFSGRNLLIGSLIRRRGRPLSVPGAAERLQRASRAQICTKEQIGAELLYPGINELQPV